MSSDHGRPEIQMIVAWASSESKAVATASGTAVLTCCILANSLVGPIPITTLPWPGLRDNTIQTVRITATTAAVTVASAYRRWPSQSVRVNVGIGIGPTSEFAK